MSLIGYALRMARKYYEPKTYNHALRVATYVMNNQMIPDDKIDDCIALAIMHDLFEDTEYNLESIKNNSYFKDCLCLLTRDESITYIEYVKKIRDKSDIMPEAYWVKLADMKDHLTQTETLTESLKEKYVKALPYLL